MFPVGLAGLYIITVFPHFHNLCMREAKALVRLRVCAVSSEPTLLADAISFNISCACQYLLVLISSVAEDFNPAS